MKNVRVFVCVLVFLVVLALGVNPGAARALLSPLLEPAMGTAFTYQGQLVRDGQPVSEECEMTFSLYDAASGGDHVGEPITQDITVSAGSFTTLLDFGAGVFTGDPRWLAVDVQCAGDQASTALPRQAITAAPYAITASLALDAGLLDGHAAGNASGDIPINNGTLNTGLNADQVDGLNAGNTSGSIPINNGTLNTGLNADQVDGLNAGNTSGSIPINNGTLNTGLNADQVDGLHAGDFQARVTGKCAVGSTIRAIGSDGSVTCQADAPLNRSAPPADNTITIRDSSDKAGAYNSLVIGADGLPFIIYSLETGMDYLLKAAHCDDVACASASTVSLDSEYTGGNTSVVIGADGLPLIVYMQYSFETYDFTINVIHCDDAACASASNNALIHSNIYDYHTSTAIGVDGLPVISFIDSNLLAVAHCESVDCSTATWTVIEQTDTILTEYHSLVIGADGFPLIAYNDENYNNVRVAHCGDIACASAGSITFTTIETAGDVGQYISATIGVDGLPLITYRDATNADLRVAHCGDLACADTGAISFTSYGGPADTGWHTSVTVGADGMPIIGYQNATDSSVRVLRCANFACTSGSEVTIDSDDNIGHYINLSIGVDGLPVLSYYDITNQDLDVAHCSNTFCVPYFRRR